MCSRQCEDEFEKVCRLSRNCWEKTDYLNHWKTSSRPKCSVLKSTKVFPWSVCVSKKIISQCPYPVRSEALLSLGISVAFLVFSKLYFQHVLITGNTRSGRVETGISGGYSWVTKNLPNNHVFLEFCRKGKSRALLGRSFKQASFYMCCQSEQALFCII